MTFVERLKRLLGSADSQEESGEEEPKVCTGAEAITCMEALEKIYEYLDGELEGISEEQVAEHFRICKNCYPHLELEKAFHDAIHRARSGEEAPETLKRKVLDSLMAEGFTPTG